MYMFYLLQGFDADDVVGDYNGDPDVENDVINKTDMKVIRGSIPTYQFCQSLNTIQDEILCLTQYTQTLCLNMLFHDNIRCSPLSERMPALLVSFSEIY